MPQGYEVNAEQVSAAGRSACELAEALRSVRSAWDGATRDGALDCGMDIVGTAYARMQDAWFDEVGVHIVILEQACDALQTSAEGYRRHDEAAARGLRGEISADVL